MYTDTEVAMALQQIDDEQDLVSFNDTALQAGTKVKVEGEVFVIRRVDARLFNFDILGNHHSYPLSFDTTDASSGYVFSIEVHLDRP